MGKIKSKAVKKASVELIDRKIEFTEDFEKNKSMLKGTMSSKKVRNQMAGYLSRLKRQERVHEEEMGLTKK